MKKTSGIYTGLATFAGVVLLGGATAFAQANPGAGSPGAMQQQPGQTQPGTAPGAAGQTDNMGTTNNGQMASSDKIFVKKAMEGGLAEVQLGQLALQKSNNPDVKQFAQKMVDDHTKLNDQMKPIAEQLGVNVPDSPSKKDKATMAKLQGLSGDSFDKAYMKDMVKDHKTDLSEFKTEAQNGSNPQVKQAASQGAEVISQHLQMAEQIAPKVGAGSSNTKASMQ